MLILQRAFCIQRKNPAKIGLQWIKKEGVIRTHCIWNADILVWWWHLLLSLSRRWSHFWLCVVLIKSAAYSFWRAEQWLLRGRRMWSCDVSDFSILSAGPASWPIQSLQDQLLQFGSQDLGQVSNCFHNGQMNHPVMNDLFASASPPAGRCAWTN